MSHAQFEIQALANPAVIKGQVDHQFVRKRFERLAQPTNLEPFRYAQLR